MEDLMHSTLFFEPESASGTAFIFLHGGESSNEALRPLAPFFNEASLILPQASIKIRDDAYSWFNFVEGTLQVDKESFTQNLEVGRRLIQSVRNKYSNEKLFIGGLSQGAVFANELFLENPDLFGGLISMSGFLNDRDSYNSLFGKSILICHGESDPIIPIEQAVKEAETLRSYGAEVDFKSYDMGHELSEEELKDAANWLCGL